MNRERPLLIYDGDCGFCRRWVERLRAITGDRVDYRAAQDVGAEFPDVPAEAFDRSVQFVAVDGRRVEQAEAVFRALAVSTFYGRLLVWSYGKVPLFAAVCDGLYRLVARNRLRLARWM